MNAYDWVIAGSIFFAACLCIGGTWALGRIDGARRARRTARERSRLVAELRYHEGRLEGIEVAQAKLAKEVKQAQSLRMIRQLKRELATHATDSRT